MEICDAIKQIRLELGLTQVVFAKKLHVSFLKVNRWENGRVQPIRLATMMIILLSDEIYINSDAIQILRGCIGDE